MKIIATLTADFQRSAIGTRSRLTDSIAGETVIRRTLRRVAASTAIDSIHLLVHKSQASQARTAVEGLNVRIETHETADVPWRQLMTSARKWSLDAWRGGLAGACVFDETAHPWLLEALGRREQADGIVDVNPAAVLLDPNVLDAMIAHFADVRESVRMTFTQSAPGLTAAVYTTELMADLAQAGQSVGGMMVYRPAEPRRDMIMLPCFWAPDTLIRRACGRCVVDTDSAFERVEAILADLGPSSSDGVPEAGAVSGWLLAHRFQAPPALPAEVEVELTTEDPLFDTVLRPRGAAVGLRGPMTDVTFDRLVTELAERDDARLVFGGFGDPLRHPAWPVFVKRAREAGVYGIAVRTTAVDLDDAAITALMDARVDVVEVLLDAHTPETYAKLSNSKNFNQVRANLDRLLDQHRQRQQPQPLLVCSLTKTHETMDELEAFYDLWVSRTGSAVITGPSTFAGQWPDRSVMDMAPPTREPCERLWTRTLVLADGRVTACDQDFKGAHALGDLREQTLAGLWGSPCMTAIRASHRGGACDGMSLCPTCREWHRP